MKLEKNHENVTQRDKEYIEAYLKYNSQTKAAKECNVGRSTIARAVSRAGISLEGRKNNGKNQKGEKITDSQIIKDSKTLSGIQIARKYNISIERLYIRAKRLGITFIGNNKWYDRVQQYSPGSEFDSTITLEKVIEKYKGICQICGKPIDKNDIEKGHIKRNYPTVDHIKPLSKGGLHTWNNVQLAHMACNAGKCDK